MTRAHRGPALKARLREGSPRVKKVSRISATIVGAPQVISAVSNGYGDLSQAADGRWFISEIEGADEIGPWERSSPAVL